MPKVTRSRQSGPLRDPRHPKGSQGRPQSSQLEPAQDLANVIKQVARQVPGTADARIAQRIDYPILDVEMNRELASRLGLNPNEVMKNLVAATNSSINFQPAFWIDEVKGNHYFLGVQYREERLDSLETLRTIPVGWKDNRPIRLGTIAEIRRKTGPSVIYHRNISRVTDVYVNVRPCYDVGGVVSAIEQRLEELGAQESADERGTLYRADTMAGADSNRTASGQFEGITFRMMGEVRTMRESFSQFINGLAIAAILVYLVLVAQWLLLTGINADLAEHKIAMRCTPRATPFQRRVCQHFDAHTGNIRELRRTVHGILVLTGIGSFHQG